MPLPIVLVVDTGVDDALALIIGARHPAIDLRGVVATAGNVPVGTALANTRFVLDLAGRPDIPVAVGAGHRLDGTPFPPRPVHGPDGLAGLAPVDARPPLASPPASAAPTGAEVIVSLGPLTSLVGQPECRVVASYARRGEANYEQDPAAAHVLAQQRRWIEHVTADHAGISTADLATFGDENDQLARLAVGLLRHQAGRGAGLGDAGVVLTLADPGLPQESSTRRLLQLVAGRG